MRPEAAALYTRGLERFAARDYAGAIADLEAGYAIEPRREFLFAEGQAKRLAGDCKGAVALYQRFLATNPTAVQANATQIALGRCAQHLADHPEVVVVEPPRRCPRRRRRRPSGGAIRGAWRVRRRRRRDRRRRRLHRGGVSPRATTPRRGHLRRARTTTAGRRPNRAGRSASARWRSAAALTAAGVTRFVTGPAAAADRRDASSPSVDRPGWCCRSEALLIGARLAARWARSRAAWRPPASDQATSAARRTPSAATSRPALLRGERPLQRHRPDLRAVRAALRPPRGRATPARASRDRARQPIAAVAAGGGARLPAAGRRQPVVLGPQRSTASSATGRARRARSPCAVAGLGDVDRGRGRRRAHLRGAHGRLGRSAGAPTTPASSATAAARDACTRHAGRGRDGRARGRRRRRLLVRAAQQRRRASAGATTASASSATARPPRRAQPPTPVAGLPPTSVDRRALAARLRARRRPDRSVLGRQRQGADRRRHDDRHGRRAGRPCPG